DVTANRAGTGDDDFHAASALLREGARDDAALDLAGRGARNRLRDVNLLRPLELREAILAVRDEVSLADRRLDDDRGGHFLAPRLVRHAEADGLGDRRVRQQHFVDLARRNLFAAPIDQLLDARDERQVALRVEEPLIARAEPAVGERLRVRFRIVL